MTFRPETKDVSIAVIHIDVDVYLMYRCSYRITKGWMEIHWIIFILDVVDFSLMVDYTFFFFFIQLNDEYNLCIIASIHYDVIIIYLSLPSPCYYYLLYIPLAITKKRMIR